MAIIVPDINILLYAHDTQSSLYVSAQSWLTGVLSSDDPVGLTWHTIYGFLRIATDPRLPGDRFPMDEALSTVNEWLELPHVQILMSKQAHWTSLRKTIVDGQIRGALVSDAVLAALTMEHGGVLYTTDRDFARFPGLRWTNPLLSK